MFAPLGLILTLLLAAPVDMDLEAFRIMERMHSRLTDLECEYEGGTSDLSQGETRDSPGETFQGDFAFRNDGSVSIDVYANHENEKSPLARYLVCLTENSKLEEVSFRPDMPKSFGKPKQSPGGLVSLQRRPSPLSLFTIIELMELVRDSGGFRTDNGYLFENLGWQEVDGVRCLAVRFFTKASTEDGQPNIAYTYWLDLNRGGIPLKREYRNGGRLGARTQEIEIAKFQLPSGETHWLPVHGVVQSFQGNQDQDETTADRETIYDIVAGTVILNQGLPDARFSIKWVSTAKSPDLQAARAEFDRVARIAPQAKRKARLETDMAVAAQQKKVLEASAPSREWWSWTILSSSALTIAGVIMLLWSLRLRRRGG